jgi:hypothetical protein
MSKEKTSYEQTVRIIPLETDSSARAARDVTLDSRKAHRTAPHRSTERSEGTTTRRPDEDDDDVASDVENQGGVRAIGGE